MLTEEYPLEVFKEGIGDLMAFKETLQSVEETQSIDRAIRLMYNVHKLYDRYLEDKCRG